MSMHIEKLEGGKQEEKGPAKPVFWQHVQYAIWLGSTSFRLKTTGSYACHYLLSCLLGNWRVMILCGDRVASGPHVAEIHIILKLILLCGWVKRGLV